MTRGRERPSPKAFYIAFAFVARTSSAESAGGSAPEKADAGAAGACPRGTSSTEQRDQLSAAACSREAAASSARWSLGRPGIHGSNSVALQARWLGAFCVAAASAPSFGSRVCRLAQPGYRIMTPSLRRRPLPHRFLPHSPERPRVRKWRCILLRRRSPRLRLFRCDGSVMVNTLRLVDSPPRRKDRAARFSSGIAEEVKRAQRCPPHADRCWGAGSAVHPTTGRTAVYALTLHSPHEVSVPPSMATHGGARAPPPAKVVSARSALFTCVCACVGFWPELRAGSALPQSSAWRSLVSTGALRRCGPAPWPKRQKQRLRLPAPGFTLRKPKRMRPKNPCVPLCGMWR